MFLFPLRQCELRCHDSLSHIIAHWGRGTKVKHFPKHVLIKVYIVAASHTNALAEDQNFSDREASRVPGVLRHS